MSTIQVWLFAKAPQVAALREGGEEEGTERERIKCLRISGEADSLSLFSLPQLLITLVRMHFSGGKLFKTTVGIPMFQLTGDI